MSEEAETDPYALDEVQRARFEARGEKQSSNPPGSLSAPDANTATITLDKADTRGTTELTGQLVRLRDGAPKSRETIRQHPAPPNGTSPLDAANAAIRKLLDDLTKAHRRGTPCDHVTLRPPHLPCPHPDCWSGSKRLRMAKQKNPPVSFSSSASLSPMDSVIEQEDWQRGTLTLDGQEFWAWRKL